MKWYWFSKFKTLTKSFHYRLKYSWCRKWSCVSMGCTWCRSVFEVRLQAKIANCLLCVLISVFTAPEPTSQCSRAHLPEHWSESEQPLISPARCWAGGGMDWGQRILRGPCGSTRAPKSPVTRNNGVYGWPDAQRWHSHCGPRGEVESSVKAAPGQLSLGYPSLVPDSGSSDRAGTRGSWGYSLCGVWNWAG